MRFTYTVPLPDIRIWILQWKFSNIRTRFLYISVKYQVSLFSLAAVMFEAKTWTLALGCLSVANTKTWWAWKINEWMKHQFNIPIRPETRQYQTDVKTDNPLRKEKWQTKKPCYDSVRLIIACALLSSQRRRTSLAKHLLLWKITKSTLQV